MVARDDKKTAVINGLRYPLGNVVQRSQLGIFDRKFIVGDASADSDQYQSSLILSNFSGGIGIEDSDEGADTTRFWFGVADSRSPRMLALPPLVTATKPGGASGTARPIGVVGTQFYCAFDDDAYAWKSDNTGWHSTANDIGVAPVGKAVAFDGKVWIPEGASGYARVTESNASNGTLSITTGATPEAVSFAVWNNALYAIATDGDLWKCLQGSTTWNMVVNSGGTTLTLHTGETPKKLVSYYNRAGEPTLWLITDGSAYMYYETAVEWRRSNIQFPPHPDFGRAACVWRTGEDLWISAATDVVRQTTGNAIVPLSSGLSRDQGLPQAYRGTIVDLEPEISTLYALVGGMVGTSGASAYTYAAKVGAAGSGNGQFANPRGLVVTSGGDVWVADTDNERVQKLTSGLSYSAQFGSSGTGNGNFAANDGAYDIDRDGSGNLWVLDRGNHRIQKFDSSGSYLSQIDGHGTTSSWAYDAKFGSDGSSDGAFNHPYGIARNSAGALYVADFSNNRLQKFDSSGSFVSKITGLTGCRAVCIDSSDNVYVVYGSTGTVRKYNSAHTLQWTQTFGSELLFIATDNTNLYVTDRSGATGNRVWKRLCSTGAAVTTWGTSGTGDGQFSAPTAIAYNAACGCVFVTDYGNDRVQYFTTGGVFQGKFGTHGSGDGQFDGPWGIACNPSSGDVYVLDEVNNDIQAFDMTGTFLRSYEAGSGTGDGQFSDPFGITADSSGTVWVTDYNSSGTDRVQTFVLTTSSGGGTGDGQFSSPQALAIKRASGRVYVADTGNHRIEYFTAAGAYEGKWGGAGSGNGQFSSPNGIAVNQSSGEVYVVDSGNARVQVFSASGTYARKWGTSGTGDGQFLTPTAIALHPVSGNVLVADSGRDDIQEFTPGGTFVRRVGSAGSGNGQVTNPLGLDFNDAGDALYVSDAGNSRVQKFTLDSVATSAAVSASASLHGWPGTGWHGLWINDDADVNPTWAVVSAPTTHYRLWWGMDDGNAYWMPLRRGFHNPMQGFQAGIDTFAASGFLITSKFDAGMAGFEKLASHVVVEAISATSTETIAIEFAIDSGGWESLGTVSATGETRFSFGDAGRVFNTIQFRITLARGSNTTLTPLLRSLTLLFVKEPQQARSLVFTIVPTPTEQGQFGNRTAQDMFNEFDELMSAGAFFAVAYNGMTYEHCRLASVTGYTNIADTGGQIVATVVELPTSVAA